MELPFGYLNGWSAISVIQHKLRFGVRNDNDAEKSLAYLLGDSSGLRSNRILFRIGPFLRRRKARATQAGKCLAKEGKSKSQDPRERPVFRVLSCHNHSNAPFRHSCFSLHKARSSVASLFPDPNSINLRAHCNSLYEKLATFHPDKEKILWWKLRIEMQKRKDKPMIPNWGRVL